MIIVQPEAIPDEPPVGEEKAVSVRVHFMVLTSGLSGMWVENLKAWIQEETK